VSPDSPWTPASTGDTGNRFTVSLCIELQDHRVPPGYKDQKEILAQPVQQVSWVIQELKEVQELLDSLDRKGLWGSLAFRDLLDKLVELE
jgi:hypothetical protein